MPYPILWVAEYLTLDGENIRWGRGFRQAGFYANIMLWTAFGLWFVDIVLFLVAPRAGCYILGLIGAFLLTGNIVYAGVIHKWPDLVIPFNDHADLKLKYDWSFYLILESGIACVLSAIYFLVLDIKWPTLFRSFFDYSIDEELEVVYKSVLALLTMLEYLKISLLLSIAIAVTVIVDMNTNSKHGTLKTSVFNAL